MVTTSRVITPLLLLTLTFTFVSLTFSQVPPYPRTLETPTPFFNGSFPVTVTPSVGVTSLPVDPYLFHGQLLPEVTSAPVTLPPDFSTPSPLTPGNKSEDSGSYIMTAPTIIIPGFDFTIGFESLADKPCYLKARLYQQFYDYYVYDDQVDIVTTYGTFARGYPGELKLPIPDNLRPGYSYYWEVTCVNTTDPRFQCPFMRDGQIHPQSNFLYEIMYDVTTIFVQTDKAIYKPGQLVHYRVFAVYPDLSMYQGNFNIYIKDPNGNLIRSLRDVKGVEGVMEGSLPLSDQPLMGDWKISVAIQTTTRSDLYTKTFTVQQYQLPRFEVTVDLPPYLLNTDTELTGTVKASYTFGQPVSGLVEIHVMSASAGLDQCGNEPRHVELAFQMDGESKFSVPMHDISRVASTYPGSEIKVVARLKEALTDVTLEGSSKITVRSSPYKVNILDNTPSVFKPGLPFTVFALVTMADGSPVQQGTEAPHDVTLYVDAHYRIPTEDPYFFGASSFYGNYPLPSRSVPLPPSGLVTTVVHVPHNATRLEIKVEYQNVSDSQPVQKMFSRSNNYLQLSVLDKGVKSGQTAWIKARATEPMTQLRYQLLARGVVYESKVIDAQGQQVLTFDLPVTPKMAPTARMTAYYIRPDLELVPDSLAFNVQGLFDNQVTVEMSTNRTEPHSDLEVTVKADPGSLVSLLAVDQSVLLLKSGNDVTPKQVGDAVGRYDRGTRPSDDTHPLSLSRASAGSTLQSVGLRVYTDGNLMAQTTENQPQESHLGLFPPVLNDRFGKGSSCTWNGEEYQCSGGGTNTGTGTATAYPPWYTGETPTAYPGLQPGVTLAPGMTIPILPEEGGSGLKEVERVRNFFPETWLWMNSTLGANGTWTFHTTVPDTITSWLTTAIATNSRTGLGTSLSPTKLTVFRSFFVSLTMPSSVVRGEHVVIQASVFNYLPSNLTVDVSLPGSSGYTSIIIGEDGSESMSSGDVLHTVIVEAGGQTAVYFPVVAVSLGAVDVEVSARSHMAADAIRRPLRVVAEGVPAEFSIPVFINLNATGNDVFTDTFHVTLPDDVIDGTLRTRVKVTGDVLGPSVSGLEGLLQLPTGCGEQNMVTFAPDLYIASYLRATGQLSENLEHRIDYLLNTGYQRELTYQRTDGAFSAFGNRDDTGSTWLTAFVMRVFHEARDYVYVADGVLQRCIDWLTGRQNEDGSFNEFGDIIDPQMRQFHDHSQGLTAVVLMALLENSDVPKTQSQTEALHSAIGNATLFLEYMPFSEDHDLLSLSLTCLALTKASSSLADSCFTELMSRATVENGMTYWKVTSNSPVTSDPWHGWRPAHVRARPIDIQVTSYALLVMTSRGMTEEGMGVLHWLTRQRNSQGGFSSTQDTVIALEAMTQFVQNAVSRGYDLQLEVSAEHVRDLFNINDTNALVLQTKDYSFVPTDVTFRATGRGVAVAELDVSFHVEKDLTEPAFDVSTILLDDYLNSFRLMICTRWLLPGESGMVVQEVGIPSGFAPDMSSLGNVAGIKRSEQRGRYLNVYFDKMTKNSVCYTVMFDRQSKVAHSQSAYVITQDYYEPNHRAVVSYQSLSQKNSEVCDVCPDCCPHA